MLSSSKFVNLRLFEMISGSISSLFRKAFNCFFRINFSLTEDNNTFFISFCLSFLVNFSKLNAFSVFSVNSSVFL